MSVPAQAGEHRSPPHNLEAEQALLGALLVNNDALHLVATVLEPDHFLQPVHCRIYDAVMHFVGRRETANPVTLKTYFENDEALKEAGGGQCLMAHKTRASRRTVQRHLRVLEGDGVLIEVKPATRRFPAEYQISLQRLLAEQDDQGRQTDTPGDQGRHPDHSGASSATNQGRHGDAQTVNSNSSKESINARARARERELEEEFEAWYRLYPRKASRGAAEEAFAQARENGASLELLMVAVERYASQVTGREPKFIKHPSTWLNQKCWLDEPEPVGAGAGGELTWWQKERREKQRARKAAEEKGEDS